MTFFYDLNKRMAELANKQTLAESAVAERATGDYSATKARAGKDIGKPGKQFAKIAKGAAEKYGSKERGEKVAGAVLAKLRGKTEEGILPLDSNKPKKSDIPAYQREPLTLKDLEAEKNRGISSPQALARARGIADEGNAFTGALKSTPKGEKFKVGRKEFTDTSSLEEVGMTPKQKSFAKLAPPTDKITFADKIAGAKKEVDEVLGQVAADAIKKAVGGGRGREAAMDEDYGPMEEAWPSDEQLRSMQSDPKDRTRSGRHDIKKISTGTVYTRRLDDEPEDTEDSGEKKGRGRPKSTKGPRQERVTAKSRKTDRTAHGQSGFKKAVKEEDGGDDCKAAIALLKKNGYKVTKAEEELEEKAVSKKQQKFMGMVHAAQKGEKPASKEVAKVAKEMPKKAAKDFASTKHKGLPEKVDEISDETKASYKKKAKAEVAIQDRNKNNPGSSDKDKALAQKSADKRKAGLKKLDKEEEVEESSTTAGSVAPSVATSKSSGGMSFGKGIYDSLNRDLEAMIAESMNISVNSSTEGGNSITITATEEDATKLASLLKMAGLQGGEESSSCGCGATPCACNDAQEVDENAPDYPTDQVEAEDNFEYSGGLNGPKSTGQTTVPVVAGQDDRMGVDGDDLSRLREMAGIKEAKKPDFLDVDKDGDKKEPMKKALKYKEDKKVEESLVAHLWQEYKGQ